MSFAVYRKYEKPLLGAAVVFTVVVFIFFPSFGDMSDVLGGRASGDKLFGSFTEWPTGKSHDVSELAYSHAKRGLALFMGRNGELSDDAVWQHLMLVADARAAGLVVTDTEIGQGLRDSFPGQPVTAELYTQIWRNMLGFPSARAFDEFYREILLSQRWREALEADARVVDANDVYQRWRVDNELFDLDVMLFPDVEPESIADPGDDVLTAWFDEMPVYLRERRFADPARYDLAVAWLPLDADTAGLPAERLADLPAIEDADIQLRFDQQKATRFPDMEQLDDDTREVLRRELTLIELVTAAHRDWVAAGQQPAVGPDAEDGPPARTIEEFTQTMGSWGLSLSDPQGELGPDELEALPEIGSPNLAARLINAKAGDVRYFRPFGEETRALVLFVQSVVPETPLGFAEAREQVLEAWRAEPAQVAAAAQGFRDTLRERARAVPEAAAIVEPLEQAARDEAQRRIDESVAAGEELDDLARQAIVDEQLAAAQPDIASRLAEFEQRAWDELVGEALSSGGASERLAMDAVPRSWRQKHTGPDVDRTTVEYFVKSNGRVFQLAENGITDVLRHVTGKQSVVVRVAARGFPEMAAMLADETGMQQARDRLASIRVTEWQVSLMPERMKAARSEDNPFGHGLRIVVQPDEAQAADGAADQDPDS